MEIPKQECEKYMSFIGHVDSRVELERSIKPGDCRYLFALSVMASKISYENHTFVKSTVQHLWKMELVGFYDFWNGKATTQALIFQDKTSNPNMIVVALRGTEPLTRTRGAPTWTYHGTPSPGWIKSTVVFIKALGLQRRTGWPKQIKPDPDRPLAYYCTREKLGELLQLNRAAKFLVTGHSQGGALAALFPAVLALHRETSLLNRLHGIYTYGQPRVGNEKFNQFMEGVLKKHGCKYFRFVYSHDIVPRMPTDDPSFMFKHFGTCLYFNSGYCGKIIV